MSCVSRGPASPEIVPLAEEEVALGVEAVAHLAQSAVAAPALETVLVPEHVQGLQSKSESDHVQGLTSVIMPEYVQGLKSVIVSCVIMSRAWQSVRAQNLALPHDSGQ